MWASTATLAPHGVPDSASDEAAAAVARPEGTKLGRTPPFVGYPEQPLGEDACVLLRLDSTAGPFSVTFGLGRRARVPWPHR
jgi:hypothetical protein